MNLENAMALFRRGQEAARFDGLSSEQVLDEYARARDEAAFRELLRRHAGHVWAVCRRELSDAALAEDAFQTTFLALVRQAKEGKRFDSLAGWLDLAARRTAGKLRRKHAHAGATVEVAVAAPPDDSREQKERSEQVRVALADLPDRYRLPLTYRYLAGLSPADTARALGVPEDTGKTQLKRGLQMLREKLGGKGLGIGVAATTGSVSLESALTAAAERVPNTVLVATLGAVRALPIKRGILAAVMGVVTFRRAMVAGFTLAGGMATALVLMPGPQPRLMKVSSNTSLEKDRTMRGSPLLVALAAFGLAPKAPAQTFTKLVDTSTSIPNGTGVFTSFLRSYVSSSMAGFHGFGSNGQQGFYTTPIVGGLVTRIADLSTAIPQGTGNFTDFATSSSFSGSTVAFQGTGLNGQTGIYTGTIGGQLGRVADATTSIPGNAGTFNIFFGNTIVEISGTNVAFHGGNSNGDGLYVGSVGGGPITLLVDKNTPIPNGSGNFAGGFNYFSLSGSIFAFTGFASVNGPQGLYTGSIAGGPLKRIFDTSTPVPQGTGTFMGAIVISISGSNIAFTGSDSSSSFGIYVASNETGSITKIANKNTPVPGAVGNFTQFLSSSIHDSTILFQGTSSVGVGIYSAPITGDGPITKIVAAGDTLDGHIVSNLTITRLGNDGAIYAFVAAFSDGTTAVYSFTPVPEPAGILAVSGLTGATAVFVLRRLLGGV